MAYVVHMSKYQKAYIKCYTCNLLIFLKKFPKLVFIQIERKIANSAKTNIEVSFQKTFLKTLAPRICFKKCTVWRERKAFFFSHF